MRAGDRSEGISLRGGGLDCSEKSIQVMVIDGEQAAAAQVPGWVAVVDQPGEQIKAPLPAALRNASLHHGV